MVQQAIMGEEEDTDEDEDDEVDEQQELMNKLRAAGLDPSGRKVDEAIGGDQD
jgi:hypothetical protein